MTLKRILLKNQAGEPIASARIGGNPPCVDLPEGVTPLLFMTEDSVLTAESGVYLGESEEISILLRGDDGLLFASTLSGSRATYAKWRLLEAMKERESALSASPLEAPTESLEEASVDAAAPARQPAPQEASPPAEEELPSVPEEEEIMPVSEPERWEALLEKGEPFHLFDSVMPGSRWSIIKEDAAEYLVGVTEDERGKHLLFGVPGARDFPPDEDRLWSFFPTEENEEIGWFLSEQSGGAAEPQ